jgi:hypothetical protein
MTRVSPITGAPIRDDGIVLGRPPLWKRLNWKRILVLLIGLYLLGRYFLTGLGLTESDRVMRAITKIEEAVERKNILSFQSVLSDDYQDGSGHSKRTLVTLASRYFASQDLVEIVNLSSSVEFPAEDRAVVNLRVQVIGRTGGQWARGITDDSAFGEKYEFSLKKEDGDWKIAAVDPVNRRWPRL